MFTRIIFAVSLLLCLFGSVSCDFYCPGTTAGHLAVTDVQLIPNPPVRAKDEIVQLTGTVDETVTAGKIVLNILYLGLPVYSNTWNICDVIACPYAPGTVTASLTIPGTAIPSISPPGSYVGKATLTDQTGASLACVQVSFTLPATENSVDMDPRAAAEILVEVNKNRQAQLP